MKKLFLILCCVLIGVATVLAGELEDFADQARADALAIQSDANDERADASTTLGLAEDAQDDYNALSKTHLTPCEIYQDQDNEATGVGELYAGDGNMTPGDTKRVLGASDFLDATKLHYGLPPYSAPDLEDAIIVYGQAADYYGDAFCYYQDARCCYGEAASSFESAGDYIGYASSYVCLECGELDENCGNPP